MLTLDDLKCCGNCNHVEIFYENISCGIGKGSVCFYSRTDIFDHHDLELNKSFYRPYTEKKEHHWEYCGSDNFLTLTD